MMVSKTISCKILLKEFLHKGNFKSILTVGFRSFKQSIEAFEAEQPKGVKRAKLLYGLLRYINISICFCTLAFDNEISYLL